MQLLVMVLRFHGLLLMLMEILLLQVVMLVQLLVTVLLQVVMKLQHVTIRKDLMVQLIVFTLHRMM